MDVTRSAVDTLLSSRTEGVLDRAFADPGTLDEALRTQLEVLAELVRRGERLAGWKAAFATGQRPAGLAPEDVAFAFILERGVLPDGATVGRDQLPGCLVEAEVCLVIADPVGPIGNREQARQAVRCLVPALEINQLRCPGAPIHTVIADGLANYAIVVGGEAEPSPGPFGKATLARRGSEASATPQGAREAVDPYETLARLASALARFGVSIEPGQYVLTGSLARDTPGPAELCEYSGAIDKVGTVRVTLTAGTEHGVSA
jgi:2-keto-4-pentenoate hydratase